MPREIPTDFDLFNPNLMPGAIKNMDEGQIVSAILARFDESFNKRIGSLSNNGHIPDETIEVEAVSDAMHVCGYFPLLKHSMKAEPDVIIERVLEAFKNLHPVSFGKWLQLVGQSYENSMSGTKILYDAAQRINLTSPIEQ